ncbi:MAG: hypothetical protein WC794_02095 [Candidatus Doudnabacteria bacterium]|jgi:large-conductance mechanosensitive channel
MNLKPFFTSQYLFQINPAFIAPSEKLFALVGAVLVLLSIVFKISAVLAPTPVDKKFRGKFFSLFLTIGLSELFWYFCRYQNVKFFGSHFMAWLIVFIGLAWLVFVIVAIIKNYSKEKQVLEKEALKLKYLPK